MLWIFGFGRSGSTWLARLLLQHPRCVAHWREPLAGLATGYPQLNGVPHFHDEDNYIFGRPVEARIAAVRGMIEGGAAARFGRIGRTDLLLIQDQNGSAGSEALLEAFPGSAMVLLIRDPREVTASAKDALRPGSWGFEALQMPSHFEWDIDLWVHNYRAHLEAAIRAHDNHRGPKVEVRYEDLREDPAGTLELIGTATGWKMTPERRESVIETVALERLADETKGAGRFVRSGGTDTWQEELSSEEIEAIESGLGPVLDRYYPGWR